MRPKPIKQRATRLRIGFGRNAPPLVERRQSLRFGLRQAQPLREPFRILRYPQPESAEAADCVGLGAECRFDLDHILEARKIPDAAEHHAEKPALGHDHQRRRRARSDEKLEKLHPHALAGKRIETGTRDDAGMHAGRVGRPLAEMRVKSKEAQDAQIVFFDPLLRLADETHTACGNVGEAANIVVHKSIGRGGKRIDGEIAPLGICLPVATEHHARLAAERFHVLAQGGDFHGVLIDHGGDRAVLDAGRNCLATRGLDAADDFLRQSGRRHIDFADLEPQQGVANRTADNTRFFAIAIEECEQARDRTCFEPGSFAKMRRGCHRVVCGTNLPSSICAGT